MTDSHEGLSNSFFRRRAVLVLGVGVLLAAFFFAGGLVIGRRSVTAKLEEPRGPLVSTVHAEPPNQFPANPTGETKLTPPPEVYTVRVASIEEMADALSVVEKLHQLSYSRVALVVPPKNSVSQNILVEIGPFTDRKKADSTAADLKSQGFPLAEVFAK